MLIGTMNHPARDVIEEIEWMADMGLEFLDAEVIVQLDSEPGKSFGFQLRNDGNEQQRRGMLGLLRNAFRRDEPVRIEYTRTSIHNGVIFRVVKLH